MSEFWVSHKRYRCQYCDIFIADDAPSRQQHENGLRHKGNRERFIKGLYKQGEKQVREKEEEKREMAAIEKAANAAYAVDVGAGRGSQSALPAPIASSSKPKPATPSAPTSKWTNYTTAESLGYTDPDLERAMLEAQRRQNEGIAGEWQVVVSAQPAPAPDEQSAGAEKRSRPVEDEEDARAYKVRKKTAAVGLGELWDPGVIKIKVKDPPKEVVTETESVKEEDTSDGRRVRASWEASSWSTVDKVVEAERIKVEVAHQDERFAGPKEESEVVKVEENALKEQPPEPEPPSTTGLFKKRKAPPAGVKHGRPRP